MDTIKNMWISLDGYLEVNLEDRAYEMCTNFAEQVYSTNELEYARRGQSSKYAIIQQIADGKLGECAIYKYLIYIGKKCTFPDFTIYEKGMKSFDSDLRCDEVDIHVKSQTTRSMLRYGRSYLFQKTDPLIKKPGRNDVMGFCEIMSNNQVRFFGFADADYIVKKLGEPIKENLKFNKLALYFDSEINTRFVPKNSGQSASPLRSFELASRMKQID